MGKPSEPFIFLPGIGNVMPGGAAAKVQTLGPHTEEAENGNGSFVHLYIWI